MCSGPGGAAVCSAFRPQSEISEASEFLNRNVLIQNLLETALRASARPFRSENQKGAPKPLRPFGPKTPPEGGEERLTAERPADGGTPPDGGKPRVEPISCHVQKRTQERIILSCSLLVDHREVSKRGHHRCKQWSLRAHLPTDEAIQRDQSHQTFPALATRTHYCQRPVRGRMRFT
jgi:hypothetical protein